MDKNWMGKGKVNSSSDTFLGCLRIWGCYRLNYVSPQIQMLKSSPLVPQNVVYFEKESSKRQLMLNEPMKVSPNLVWLVSFEEEEVRTQAHTEATLCEDTERGLLKAKIRYYIQDIITKIDVSGNDSGLDCLSSTWQA